MPPLRRREDDEQMVTDGCFKIGYPSELTARRALGVIRKRRYANNQRRIEAHIYQCECSFWHLASPRKAKP